MKNTAATIFCLFRNPAVDIANQWRDVL